jgi:hypothetical protein
MDYYRRRIEQELAAAQTTRCAFARDVHRDLAERYVAKLRLIEALDAEAFFVEPKPLLAPARRSACG